MFSDNSQTSKSTFWENFKGLYYHVAYLADQNKL